FPVPSPGRRSPGPSHYSDLPLLVLYPAPYLPFLSFVVVSSSAMALAGLRSLPATRRFTLLSLLFPPSFGLNAVKLLNLTCQAAAAAGAASPSLSLRAASNRAIWPAGVFNS